jgi:hypothetical protein
MERVNEAVEQELDRARNAEFLCLDSVNLNFAFTLFLLSLFTIFITHLLWYWRYSLR